QPNEDHQQDVLASERQGGLCGQCRHLARAVCVAIRIVSVDAGFPLAVRTDATVVVVVTTCASGGSGMTIAVAVRIGTVHAHFAGSAVLIGVGALLGTARPAAAGAVTVAVGIVAVDTRLRLAV